MKGLPGWVISPMSGPPPRQHKHERQYTRSTQSVIPTRRIWNDDDDGQMIFGDHGGLKFPDIFLTGEEKNPEKKLTQETCPDRVRCVTSAHATTCSTAVDINPYSAKSLGDRLYATLHKMPGKSATYFVYFWIRKTLPYTHLEATSYIPQQGQSLHIWTTSLSTIGCYKSKYTTQFLWMACIGRFAAAILSGETD